MTSFNSHSAEAELTKSLIYAIIIYVLLQKHRSFSVFLIMELILSHPALRTKTAPRAGCDKQSLIPLGENARKEVISMDNLPFKAPIEPSEIKEGLRKLFLEERYAEFSPMSETRIKKPARKMREILEELGADFVKPPTLEQCDYKMTIVTGYGNDFCYYDFDIDFWNHEVFVD